MGRPALQGERKYQIQEMWNVHHEIKRMLLLGMKHVDIARALSISEVTVSYTANSSIVKRELDLMRGARDMEAVNISAEIQRLCPIAVEKLEELLDSQVESIKLRTAQDILDRGGHAAVQKVAVAHGHLTRDDINEIKNRAKEIGLCVADSMQEAVYVPT